MATEKYRATLWGNKVEKLKVIRETDKQIIFLTNDERERERKEAKSSNDTKWFDTAIEAIEWIFSECQENIAKAQRQLDFANDELERFILFHGLSAKQIKEFKDKSANQ